MYDEAIRVAKRVYGPGRSDGFYVARIAQFCHDSLVAPGLQERLRR